MDLSTHEMLLGPYTLWIALYHNQAVGKNSSPTLARDKAKIEHISEGQPSLYELAFGVELGPNPHSKTSTSQICIDMQSQKDI